MMSLTHAASTVQPPSTDRRRTRRLKLLIGFTVAVLCIVSLWIGYWTFAGSPAPDRATQAGMAYARQTVVWIHGPTVQRVRVVPMRDLAATLRTTSDTALRHDVDTTSLVREYGPAHRVEVIVLAGTYNSLPPDEGVDVQGDVLVVVDKETNRVLFLTD